MKVLDFGLAKLPDPAPSTADRMAAATLTQRQSPTLAGMVMGTAGYMAPEQARGQTVDKRADIWAFGVILFEMLSGGAAFGGETVTDTLAFTLTKDPEWSRLPPPLPRS